MASQIPTGLNIIEVKTSPIKYLYVNILGATSIEKIPKISASDRNIRDPSPLFEKGPYRRKCQYFVPNSKNLSEHMYRVFFNC